LAARFVRDEEAAGSNPATPTQLKGRFLSWNRLFRLVQEHAENLWPHRVNAELTIRRLAT
jgi:hypothetical protein